jgi:hypothetical protein
VKKTMKAKSITSITIIITLITLSYSGCIEVDTNKDLTLDTISLNPKDISEDCEIQNENHIKKPYIVEEGLILQGWYILEKYEAGFSFGEYYLAQTLAKLPSKNDNEKIIDIVKINYSKQFTEETIDIIGEKTFFGINTSAGSTPVYLLSFIYKDIVVILFGTSPNKEALIDYAKIIEKNINENTKK